jgi:predicted RNA binding protein YcfA (HicA-like mRNA interferase family)
LNYARNLSELSKAKASHFIGHSIYRAIIAGEVRLVTVSAHRPSEDIKPGTLDAMIRQSGLPKHLFR